MIVAILLAGAGPATAIDAERAFAADAQAIGQNSAFVKWSTPDAIFPPDQNVHAALKDAPNPPKAIDWWPTASFVSCDGRTAANTGGAYLPNGTASNFSTIWQRQADGGWKWRLDSGTPVSSPHPRTATPVVRKAGCTRPRVLPAPAGQAGAKVGGGASADRTLVWRFEEAPDKALRFEVRLWTGRGYETVIDARTPAPPAKAPA